MAGVPQKCPEAADKADDGREAHNSVRSRSIHPMVYVQEGTGSESAQLSRRGSPKNIEGVDDKERRRHCLRESHPAIAPISRAPYFHSYELTDMVLLGQLAHAALCEQAMPAGQRAAHATHHDRGAITAWGASRRWARSLSAE